MAVCEYCKNDMSNSKTTTCIKVVVNNKNQIELTPITFGCEKRFTGSEYWPPKKDERCHDCNVTVGSYHHPGCDMEECPHCQGQMISCGCCSEEKEEN